MKNNVSSARGVKTHLRILVGRDAVETPTIIEIPKGFCPPAQGCVEQPWGSTIIYVSTPTGLRRDRSASRRNPVGVDDFSNFGSQGSPAAAGQPWAGGHNPFGIDLRGNGSPFDVRSALNTYRSTKRPYNLLHVINLNHSDPSPSAVPGQYSCV